MIFLPGYIYLLHSNLYQNLSFFCLISFYFFVNSNPHFIGNPRFFFPVTYTHTKFKFHIKPIIFCFISFYFFVNFKSTLCPKPMIFLPHFLLFLCKFKSTLRRKPKIFLPRYIYTYHIQISYQTHHFFASFPFISLLISNPHFVQNP